MNISEREIGSKYWTVYINSRTNYVQILEAIWKGDQTDFLRQSEGRIFENRKDAETWMRDNI